MLTHCSYFPPGQESTTIFQVKTENLYCVLSFLQTSIKFLKIQVFLYPPYYMGGVMVVCMAQKLLRPHQAMFLYITVFKIS